MPRSKAYATNAERQAAYRARHPEQQALREDYLASLGRSVHAALESAVEDQQSILPGYLLGARADETLRNLIRYLRLHTDRGKADPLLTPFSSE